MTLETLNKKSFNYSIRNSLNKPRHYDTLKDIRTGLLPMQHLKQKKDVKVSKTALIFRIINSLARFL